MNEKDVENSLKVYEKLAELIKKQLKPVRKFIFTVWKAF